MSVPNAIINPVPRTSGIWHLPEALQRFPGAKALVYYRLSSRSQAGNGREKLQAATDLLVAEVSKVMEVVHAPFFGIEQGKLSTPRPKLREAATYAARMRDRGVAVIIVTDEASRFIRSESYDTRPQDLFSEQSKDARLSPDESVRLAEFTFGIPLATLADPLLSEAERHRRAMQRARQAGKCGRPPKPLHPDIQLRILDMVGEPMRRNGGIVWQTRINKVAEQLKRFGVSRAQVQHFLESLVPDGYRTWTEAAKACEPPERDADDVGPAPPPPLAGLCDPATQAEVTAHAADDPYRHARTY